MIDHDHITAPAADTVGRLARLGYRVTNTYADLVVRVELVEATTAAHPDPVFLFVRADGTHTAPTTWRAVHARLDLGAGTRPALANAPALTL